MVGRNDLFALEGSGSKSSGLELAGITPQERVSFEFGSDLIRFVLLILGVIALAIASLGILP